MASFLSFTVPYPQVRTEWPTASLGMLVVVLHILPALKEAKWSELESVLVALRLFRRSASHQLSFK